MARKDEASEGDAPDTLEVDRAIQLLSLEYNSIKGEMLTRTSGRFQFLGLMTTAAALVASGVGDSKLGISTWATAALAAGVFLFGLICFIFLGHQIVRMAERVADIEHR